MNFYVDVLGTRLAPLSSQRLAFGGNPTTSIATNSLGYGMPEWPEGDGGILVGDEDALTRRKLDTVVVVFNFSNDLFEVNLPNRDRHTEGRLGRAHRDRARGRDRIPRPARPPRCVDDLEIRRP